TYRASVADAQQFDPASRTLKVRLELENPDLLLRPEMFVDVEFEVREPEGISVPLDAVLDLGPRKAVFVSTGEGVFEPREVTTGTRFGDRVQIVKGWLDAAGKQHEKIFDVAWSGDRKIGTDGKLPAVGTTVDLKTATYTDAIGAPQLAAGWTDPEFKPSERAFYYARVLEIPTPRWNTYDAVRSGLPPLTDVPATIQERAWSSPWSSPIWYAPN
ncbi:MAG: DUF3604 domain-containing protein, partial [Proteobacteria bacterium]|nr:DUF3604 domain-containing protein [Pseudomonadota bacterium]